MNFSIQIHIDQTQTAPTTNHRPIIRSRLGATHMVGYEYELFINVNMDVEQAIIEHLWWKYRTLHFNERVLHGQIDTIGYELTSELNWMIDDGRVVHAPGGRWIYSRLRTMTPEMEDRLIPQSVMDLLGEPGREMLSVCEIQSAEWYRRRKIAHQILAVLGDAMEERENIRTILPEEAVVLYHPVSSESDAPGTPFIGCGLRYGNLMRYDEMLPADIRWEERINIWFVTSLFWMPKSQEVLWDERKFTVGMGPLHPMPHLPETNFDRHLAMYGPSVLTYPPRYDDGI